MNTITDTDRYEVMGRLRDRGIATVTVRFSGGNDEGGADEVDAVDAAGVAVAIPQSHAYQYTTYQDGKWVQSDWTVNEWANGQHTSRPATVDEIMWAQTREVLEQPIYDRFGGFAGEFEVHGQLVWDVATGQSTMTGEESVTHWESFD